MRLMLKTRDGGDAILLERLETGKKTLLGLYWTGEEWIPTTWHGSGRWHAEPGHPRGLDLIINETTIGEK